MTVSRARAAVAATPDPDRRAPGSALPAEGLPPMLNIGYCRAVLEYAEQHGVARHQLCTPALLRRIEEPDALGQCTLEEWHALMDRAEAALGDSSLALKLAEFVHLWHSGVVGFMIMTSATLSDAVAMLSRFHHLFTNIYRVEVVQDDTCLTMRLAPAASATSDRLAALHLGNWAVRARWLTGREHLRFDASFEIPAPPNADGYRRLFGGRVLFGQPQTVMVAPTGYDTLPVAQSHPGVNSLLRAQAIAQLEQLAQHSSGFLAQIERKLKERMGSGRVTLEQMAAELGCAPRTLQQRLETYGLTFRSLLEGVRSSQAKRHLVDPRLSLTEIALMLGFADQASFQHAFKRWTGKSPGEWRRTATQGRGPG